MKPYIHVIILNGLPENGKDSFREYCTHFVKEKAEVLYHSSIEVPKDILKQYFGWDGETKDEFWRSTMSELKAFWIRICEGPTKFCLTHTLALKNKCDIGKDYKREAFFFTDIREPEEIQKLVDTIRPLSVIGIDCKTFIITKPDRFKAWNNPSDDSVNDYEYDYFVGNDGSLYDLRQKAENYMKTILGGN